MSLHYILDGHNILHQMPALCDQPIERQRQLLIQKIETKKPQGSSRNKVTLFFDGHGSNQTTVVSVRFSLDRTADECIVQCVDEKTNRKNIIVVTDDRAVQYAVKALGAKAIGVHEFLAKFNSPETAASSNFVKGNVSSEKPMKYISQRTAHQINQEMEDLWLNKSKKKKE